MQFCTGGFGSECCFPAPGAALLHLGFAPPGSYFQARGAGAAAAAGHAARRDAGSGSGTYQAAERAAIFPAFDEGFISRLAPKSWQLLAAWVEAATATGMLDPPSQSIQPPPFNPTPRAWALITVSDPYACSASAQFVTQKKHRNLSKYGAVSCCRRGVP